MIRLAMTQLLLVSVCGCFVTTVETPTEVPPELRQVIDHPADFSESDHPLADAPFGDVRDDITSIVGCWGRAGDDLDEGRTDEVAVLSQVLKFEADGTMWMYDHSEYAPGSGLFDFDGGNRFLMLVKADYRVLNASTLDFRTRGDEAGDVLLAHVTPQGEIVPFDTFFNLVASGFQIHNSWEIGITVEGDALRTDDGFIDEPPDGSNYRYWKRLPCQGGPPPFMQQPAVITWQAWQDWLAKMGGTE